MFNIFKRKKKVDVNKYRQELFDLINTYKRYYDSIIDNDPKKYHIIRRWAHRRLNAIYLFYDYKNLSEEDKAYWQYIEMQIL